MDDDEESSKEARRWVAWPCDHGTGPAVRDIKLLAVCPAQPRKGLRAEAGRLGGMEARRGIVCPGRQCHLVGGQPVRRSKRVTFPTPLGHPLQT